MSLSLLLLGPLLANPLPDFKLRDHRGAERSLADWSDRRLVVVAFLGVDCPLVKLYTLRLNELAKELGPRGVGIVGINSNQHDQLRDIVRFAKAHEVAFPLLKDSDNAVADLFGAVRTPEVFLLDRDRRVRYRGRIDDQYGVGRRSVKAGRHDLVEAVEDLLADKPVRVPVTQATGCFIDRLDRRSKSGRVTYAEHVAPILHRHCVVCHRPGEIAPFSLTTFQETIGWAETIREVLADGRMPPWNADPAHGRFLNDPRLSKSDRATVEAWIDGGCPEGNPTKSIALAPTLDGWNIPKPDVVLSMPEPFTVPAEGTVEYQHIRIDPGFREDVWVRSAEVRPGNRAVVHHCTVFLEPPGADAPTTAGRLGSHSLTAFAPGTLPMMLSDGMAKRIPAGWKVVFVMHYTPIGTVQTDRTSLGLVLVDAKDVRREVATHLLYDEDLRIPPRAAGHRVEKTWAAPADVLLLSMLPHMHLRGKSFRFEATRPDGSTEVLLNVPRYDFNWQHRYVLEEPIRLEKGTVVRCIAVYDNSADNPSNPDPDLEVRAGTQTTDEMFNGYFDWCLADEPPYPSSGSRLPLMLGLLGTVGMWWWFRSPRRADHSPPSG